MNRDSFKPYLLTEEKEKLLWEKAIIVFDSSALLAIYFVPKAERGKIYEEIFEKLSERLWIPFQVQFEYLKNRESCIIKPIKEKYAPLTNKVKKFDNIGKTDLLSKIKEFSNETKNGEKHPYIDQSAINEFTKNINDFILQIKSFKEKVLKQIEDAKKDVLVLKDQDDVLSTLEKYFLTGREFSFDEILEITKEGKHRYEYTIPPGYGDLGRKKGTQIFGDLIIWKQILEFSKENKSPIFFITNDITKEDWCYTKKGSIISPREELIKEIKDYSNVDFWMYDFPQFLCKANKYLKSTIKEEVIQDISQFVNTKEEKGNYLKFKCDSCGKIHRYHKLDFDLDFECVDSSERNMGDENHYVAREYLNCICGNEIIIEFEVWEYPVGVHDYDSIEISGGELIESFSFTAPFFDAYDNNMFIPCKKCDENIDNIGVNLVDFYERIPLDNEYDTNSTNHKYNFVRGGKCQCCSSLHIKCPRCKSITAISEDNKNIECEGGCGLTFCKEPSCSHNSYYDFMLKLIDHRKVKCPSCGKLFVDYEQIGRCESCAPKLF